jgi:hypothetical protein
MTIVMATHTEDNGDECDRGLLHSRVANENNPLPLVPRAEVLRAARRTMTQ